MSMTFAQALSYFLDRSGMPLKHLAERSGVSYEQLKKIKQGRNRSTNVEDAQRIANAIGLTVDEFLSGSQAAKEIAVAGKVGAGATVYLVDAYAKGNGMYHVQCPPQLSPHNMVAVEIEGDSMEPVYSEGDVLFYSRPTCDGVPSEAMNRKCIVETEDGRVWAKQLKQGAELGTFNLISLNPTGTNLVEQRVKWAAPVKLWLPKDLVNQIKV